MSRLTTCGLTILLALAPVALAVDGTVLINQSTITNGLPNCPTGGSFPVIICQSGSYRLSGNLTVPDANTTAIQITADNVSLDLNGFSIIGPVVCSGGTPVTKCSPSGSGFGIVSSGGNLVSFNTNISVSNGTVRGMGSSGISLGVNTRITNIQAFSNSQTGISFITGIVSSCTASNNGVDGIFSIFNPSRVVDNVATGNGAAGIAVEAGSVVSGNVTTQNVEGIIAACPTVLVNNMATGNTVSNSFLGVTGCVIVNNSGF